MSERTKAETLARRDFFKQIGVGAAVVGGVAVGGGSDASAETGNDGTKSAGYRETAHVKTYYELAKF